MAASMANMLAHQLFIKLLSVGVILSICQCKADLYRFSPSDVLEAIDSVCLLLVDIDAEDDLKEKFAQLSSVFANDESVFIGTVDIKNFVWPSGEKLHWKYTDVPKIYQNNDIAFFSKKKVDRTCLYHPNGEGNPSTEHFTGSAEIPILVQYINAQCNTFLTPDGSMSVTGQHREEILNSLFETSEISDVTMGTIYSTPNNPLNGSVYLHEIETKQEQCDDESCEEREKNHYSQPEEVKIATCDRISLDSLDEDIFFSDYLSRSRPVIITGAAKHWKAFDKWTMDYLRELYGNETVHIKLTPGGDFEGVEPIDLWENYNTFSIPREVIQKLKYPDLVVVRPAGVNMKFGEFLDLVAFAADQASKNVSAYLEYSSIKDYMPKLREDLEEFAFIKSLKLKHLNMWLSDGNTLGRLHFDQFDNLLCQLRGRKQVLLFEPFNNEDLYEAHIQQATLQYNRTRHRFRRSQLEESTSMVMSPVNVLNPNFERFPRFADVVPINCTISEGDVLYLPSFWWHEVQSFPNMEEKRNLAVNFWYEPFLTREFPCPECKLDINSAYHHLL